MSSKHTQSHKHSPRSAVRRHQLTRKRNLILMWIGVAALVISVAGIFIFLPKDSPPLEISPAAAYTKYQQGAFLLDVRDQEEWDDTHIPGTMLIPLDQLKDRLDELPKDQDIVVVCRSGRRSKIGASILQEAGFTRVESMSGGLNEWAAANYPLEGNAP